MSKAGILVALDEKIEWLLPWWWARYCVHNTLPVTFVDLGMSYFGKAFCLKRGEVIPLSLSPSLAQLPSEAATWEHLFGKSLWENRKKWFHKPFAILTTPFQRTLWLDLDCEVLANLELLFTLEEGVHLAVETPASQAKERALDTIYEDEVLYNSGVIVYTKGDPLMEKWAEEILSQGEHFWSDQHALSRVIYNEKIPVHTLHENYNWRMSQGFNLNASIIHWVGSWGKEYIRTFGGMADELATLHKL